MAIPQLDGDELAMAQQIYRYVQDNNDESVSFSYNNCLFNLNFKSGEVEQQFVEQGGVKSRMNAETASMFADKIKAAHSFAADILLLERIKTISDHALQSTLSSILKKHPQDQAGAILKLLSQPERQSTLQTFSFYNSAEAKRSPALDKVRSILNAAPSYRQDTIAKAETAWSQIQTALELNVATPSPKSKASG